MARNSSFSRLASFARSYARAFSIASDARAASSRANRTSSSEYSRPDSALTNVIAPIALPCIVNGRHIYEVRFSSRMIRRCSSSWAAASRSAGGMRAM